MAFFFFFDEFKYITLFINSQCDGVTGNPCAVGGILRLSAVPVNLSFILRRILYVFAFLPSICNGNAFPVCAESNHLRQIY